jgi:hypothetical protein
MMFCCVVCVSPGAVCLIHARQPRGPGGGRRLPDAVAGIFPDAFPGRDVPAGMTRWIGVPRTARECVRSVSVKGGLK